MRRLAIPFSMLFTVATAFACSDGSSGDGDAGEQGGGSGGSATGGSAGATTGGSSGTGAGGATGGSSGATTGGSSGTSAGGATGGSAGSSGASGTGGGGFTKTGICGQRSEATVMASAYDGYEEFYMVSQEVVDDGRLDEFICLVRFDVIRVGAAAAGCVDLEGVPCEWTNQVEFSNPTVLMDVDGACTRNELVWNAAWMEGIDGTAASYGYVDMYSGHDSVVLKASGAAGSETWDVFGRASWDSTTGDFSFDNRLGACRY